MIGRLAWRVCSGSGCTQGSRRRSFAPIEGKILAGKQVTGRTGMDLRQMVGFGGVRLQPDADWDRMDHVLHCDSPRSPDARFARHAMG